MIRLTPNDFAPDPEQGPREALYPEMGVTHEALSLEDAGQIRSTQQAGGSCLVSFLATIALLIVLAAIAKYGDVPDKGNRPYDESGVMDAPSPATETNHVD